MNLVALLRRRGRVVIQALLDDDAGKEALRIG
jgi:hypothetical protein